MTNDDHEKLYEAVANCPPIVRDRIKQLEESVRLSGQEIVRLKNVINEHVSASTRHVVSNVEADVQTVTDIGEMRTLINTKPKHYDFYLVEPLSGWSNDHKQAFVKKVTKEFAEREANSIAQSIWNA